MTQSTYVSACDCQKPLPLIKTNYLSEFRTEIEKAKARENLGITDGQILEWGNITGYIEDNEDLHKYIKKQQSYTYKSINKALPTMKDITSILEGIEYVLRYIDLLEQSGLTVQLLRQDCTDLLKELKNLAEGQVTTNTKDIEDINTEIESINEQLKAIDVNALSLDWIKSALKDSETIKLIEENDSTTIEVKISEEKDNALDINSDGLYVKDTSAQLSDLEETTGSLTSQLESLKDSVAYATKLSDNTTSPNFEGLTVKDVKDKSLTEIMDAILFPAAVRDLDMPTLEYSVMSDLVEVGSSMPTVQPIWHQGDAGNKTYELSELLLDGVASDDVAYSHLGTYTFKNTIGYAQGSKLINNRGEETNLYIKDGEVSAEINVTTTYPWFAGNTSVVSKQPLVAFNEECEEQVINLSEVAVIKLPGAHSQITSFKLDSGIGFLDVNLLDWNTSGTEVINGIIYRVFTKKSLYYSIVKHTIKFKLSL